MCDVWLQALEGGELAGVCFLDMSAACDIVDHPLLIKKLELYGFQSNVTNWIQSYLSDRSQCVCKLLPVKHGVPQGSILWATAVRHTPQSEEHLDSRHKE